MATYEAIADALNGKLTGEMKMYDLKNNGVGYAVSNKDINQYAGTHRGAEAADHRRHHRRSRRSPIQARREPDTVPAPGPAPVSHPARAFASRLRSG